MALGFGEYGRLDASWEMGELDGLEGPSEEGREGRGNVDEDEDDWLHFIFFSS